MKAAINERYGSPDVLEVRQVAKPEPKLGEVLIRVHATTVSRTDCGMLRAHPFFMRAMIGLFRPKQVILGMDFAGTVDAIGQRVTRFKPGDRVFGMSPERFGAHAEFISMPESGEIEKMPDALAFDEAVLCEGAWYADATVGRLKSGQNILIYGASGAIGTAAVQLAKSYGAEITAVVATRHVELARSLGADQVVDYTTDDFTQIGEAFEIVFDAVGKTSYFRCRRLLKPGGSFSASDLGPWASNLLLGAWFSITGSQGPIVSMPEKGKALVERLKTLMVAGKYRGVFDRSYPLDDIADAYRYVETEQKTGIVVINVHTGP